MKFFAIIMTILILTLSLTPCGDEDTDCRQDEISLLEAHQHHDHHTSDLCSPLCVCQCCHTNLVVCNLYLSITSQRTIVENRSTFSPVLIDGISSGILQPPQV
ncbi:DUF6660 family protein [Marinoscillum sp. MHG1-6]|uniref:DUF6660 family protein n=1 Tax=Marinoscillum sp. MHG1-6 TaxID=2959627 RepID=UPI0035BE72C8